MSLYLDTSVLVSLYTLDANSAAATGQVRRLKQRIPLTPLLELELTNAIELRVFRREISKTQATAARAALDADLADVYAPAPLPGAAYTRAKQLAVRLTAAVGVRALDLLHIASALVLDVSHFYTFDQRQAKAAEAAGLTVVALK